MIRQSVSHPSSFRVVIHSYCCLSSQRSYTDKKGLQRTKDCIQLVCIWELLLSQVQFARCYCCYPSGLFHPTTKKNARKSGTIFCLSMRLQGCEDVIHESAATKIACQQNITSDNTPPLCCIVHSWTAFPIFK